jgi:hypothetical protein
MRNGGMIYGYPIFASALGSGEHAKVKSNMARPVITICEDYKIVQGSSH